MGKELCWYVDYLEKAEQPQFNLTISHKNDQVAKKSSSYFFPHKNKQKAKEAYIFQMCLFILSPQTYGLDCQNALYCGAASEKPLQNWQKQIL